MCEGASVGFLDGISVGFRVGFMVIDFVGLGVMGATVLMVGDFVGLSVTGIFVGLKVALAVGDFVGLSVIAESASVGLTLGLSVSGGSLGFPVGFWVGDSVGIKVITGTGCAASGTETDGWCEGADVGLVVGAIVLVGLLVGCFFGHCVGELMGGETTITNMHCTIVISMKDAWNVALHELLKSPEQMKVSLGGVTLARYTIFSFIVAIVRLHTLPVVFILSRITSGFLESDTSTTVPEIHSPKFVVTKTVPFTCS